MFSERSRFAEQPNRLELARRDTLAAARELLDLTESNPTRVELPHADSLLAALAGPNARDYAPEPFGSADARRAASSFMASAGVAIASENIVLTASTSEAYAFLFKLLCDPGDEVLIPAPSYPLFEQLAQLESVRVVRYPLRYDGRWHLAAAELRTLTTERTRAIIVLHPNNPTGSYLKRDELAALAAIGLPIISDEVFAPYPFGPDPERVASALCADAGLVFSLHGLSKLAGLPQLKLSWLCLGGARAALSAARARLELIADGFLSVSTPIQIALPSILAAHAPRTDAIRARLARNLDCLRTATQGSAVSPLHVEGGWYACLRVPNLLDDEAWALELLERDALLVQPGYFYDFIDGPYLVLSLLTPEADFALGIARLLARVAAVIAASR